ncbi:MAG: hypothetical protein H7834_15145 [Magnetococcus sp. YQC-9]
MLLRLSGVLLLRLAERTLAGLLFQLPPRLTRLEPLYRHPRSTTAVNHFRRMARVSA